jgi:rare lipoprotein A
MTAACRDVPKGTIVRVVNTSNGKSVVVKINDYIGHRGRVIDLSSDAFAQLAPLGQGVIKNVRIEKYYP